MNLARGAYPAVIALALLAVPSPAQQLKPETEHAFDCYIQSAEARMAARPAFILADADSALNQKLVRGQRVETILANGPNPHKLAGGQLYDWIGTVFLPGAKLARLLRMLQDYDRRPQYFPETISASKLLCRSGDDHFRYSMRMKEPAILDVESDVLWQRVDEHRWRCRSYSTKVTEAGKDHGYLRRLYSYWHFAETDAGVYVESETITLSDEFGAMSRTLGSMLLGINPEKSLRHSLGAMRDSLGKAGEIPAPASGLQACGEAVRPGGCAASGTF
jgi:hypothetical protein